MAANIIKGIDDEKKILLTGTGRLKAEVLCNYFMKYGVVNRVRVFCDFRGEPKGYAIVLFNNGDAVNRVLISRVYHFIGGRRIYPKRLNDDGKITIHPSIRDIPDTWKIFVGGITPYISDRDIKTYFSQFGYVMRVFTPVDPVKNRRKAFSIVTFTNYQVVDYLVKYFNVGHFIKGKDVEIRTVFPKYRERPVKNEPYGGRHDDYCGDLWSYAYIQR